MGRAISLVACLALAGCASGGNLKIATIEGACEVFEPPKYAVKGVTRYDQRWIDGNTEAGIGACRWPRPQARPAELGGAPVARRAAPKKKPGIFTRIKRSVVGPAQARPEPDPEPLPPAREVVVPPPQPAKPRDPVLDFLEPTRR